MLMGNRKKAKVDQMRKRVLTDRTPKKIRVRNPRSPKKGNISLKNNALRGYRIDQGIFFKSKMEANTFRFYKYLQRRYNAITHVKYEPWLFSFADNPFNIYGYIPDLEITSASGVFYIEVKGRVDDTCIKKARLLSQNYPGIKLYFVTPKQYNRIKNIYASVVPGWE